MEWELERPARVDGYYATCCSDGASVLFLEEGEWKLILDGYMDTVKYCPYCGGCLE